MGNEGTAKDAAPAKTVVSLTVLVAALGYFVDIFDLQLFNLVSKKSLVGIGITDEALVKQYDYLLFLWQMGGMLIGGLVWGILGDRLGRKSTLFGSILLYSVANIANGLVTSLEQYEAVRLLAGLGLAGELGAAITLVSETMDKERRGWGTMVVVTVGAFGAVAANLISRNFSWQVSYFVGGGLGLALLALRVGTFESTMFNKVKSSTATRGDFFSLFRSGKNAVKYVACILVGLPVWFVIGILIKFSDAFGLATGVDGKVSPGDAIMYAYLGLSVGDLISGALSQWLRSRRKVVFLYLVTTVLLTLAYVFIPGLSLAAFGFLCFLLGAATGYWALFVTIAAEQFGTNIRATVTTTVPNFVRGGVIPLVLSYKALEGAHGPVQAALVVGAVSLALAFAATWVLGETFGKDLDYTEG
ncbi:MAG: MFS transporter [Myxococcaceae bacterium]|nr:MFS transporter [Myxococcaceae bacterium]